MILFKIIFAITSVLPLQASKEVDEDGWYTVPRPKKEDVQGSDERDLSVWVVFSKQIGAEKFLISMPNEPVYRYTDREGSQMEVYSTSGNDQFSLQVLKTASDDPNYLLDARKISCPIAMIVEEVRASESNPYSELTYWYEGNWYHERVVVTGESTYFLQTKSPDFSLGTHNHFASSFNTEIR